MRRKIFLWISVLIISMMVLLGILSVFLINANERASLIREIKEKATTIALMDKNSGILDYNISATELSAAVGARITFIDRDGVVIGDSYASAETLENHANREEIVAALASGWGTAIRFSDTQGQDVIYGAIALEGSQMIVRLAVPVASFFDTVQTYWVNWFIVLLCILFAGIFVALRMAKHLAEPLTQLAETAKAFASGKYGVRMMVSEDQDEIRRLSQSFNEMGAQLETTIHNMEEQNSIDDAIISSLLDGIIAVDGKLSILFLNDTVCRILGLDAKVQGESILQIPKIHQLAMIFLDCVRKGETREVEFIIGMKNPKNLRVRIAPMNSGGQCIGAVGVIQDFTALRQLEHVRSDFVANASHELRTPLTSIKGYAETLSFFPELGAKEKEFIAIINAEADRLSRLIDDLLSLSIIEKGGFDDLSPTEFAPCLLKARDILGHQAAEKNIEIKVDLPETPILIPGDEDIFEQLALNLLDNAVKYSPGGSVVLATVTDGGDTLIFKVEDQGIGIAEDQLDRIFERFYRVDQGRSRESGGTGLGLSIVKHIAQGLGGDVSVESEVGKGSVFSVRLPKRGGDS